MKKTPYIFTGLLIAAVFYAFSHSSSAQVAINMPRQTPAIPTTYVDGTYTGAAADAYYGMVQVRAVVANGKIANVQFLQYPSDRSTSRAINGQAMSMLTQEAIQAQSAQVSGVSGATETSQAFIRSLTSALSQA